MRKQSVPEGQRWTDEKAAWLVISVKNRVAVLKRVGRGSRRNNPDIMYRPVEWISRDMKLVKGSR